MTISLSPARPLRAVGLIVGLWIAGRGAFVWMNGDTPPIVAASGPILPRSLPLPIDPFRKAAGVDAVASLVAVKVEREPFGRSPAGARVWSSGDDVPRGDAAPPTVAAVMPPALRSPLGRETAAPTVWTPPTATLVTKGGKSFASWSGSFWLAARNGAAPGLAARGGQLGGAQAGVRLYRHLTPGLALTGRVSTALSVRQSEASLGIALRRGAFAVLAERRLALDAGGRNDWSLTAVAGIDDVALPLGLRLDGYAQAGIVGRDGFADGALRVERTIVEKGAGRLAIGLGSWGGVQPGLARLDIGPQVVARTWVAGQPFRLSAEWRQRIAGNAQPGSGPVITLSADF